MLRIVVHLPSNRLTPGTLSAEDEEIVLGPFACLGKSDNATARKHNNPARDPRYRFGDTPVGEWLIVGVISTGTPGLPTRSYGPHGALNLEPVSGECVVAKRNGRDGIWIHAGDAAASGKLRPTFGCLRLSNEDQARLVALARKQLKEGKIPLSVKADL